jgi:hypothetical protein
MRSLIRNFLAHRKHVIRLVVGLLLVGSNYVGITGTYQHVLRLTAQLWKARCSATDGRVTCKLIVDGNEIPFENRRFLLTDFTASNIGTPAHPWLPYYREDRPDALG